MDSTLNDKLIAGLDEELSGLRRELGVNPSDPTAGIKRFRAPSPFIDWLSVLCWQHPLVLLLGGGRPPLIRR